METVRIIALRCYSVLRKCTVIPVLHLMLLFTVNTVRTSSLFLILSVKYARSCDR